MNARLLGFLAIAAVPLAGGCASVAIPAASSAEAAGAAGAGAGAREGVSYATSGKQVRTFTFPEDKVHTATLAALRKMRIYMIEDKGEAHVCRIRAATKELKIAIAIFPVTLTVSKISVSAKRGVFSQDVTVAAEIINQVSLALGERAEPLPMP